MKKLNDMPTFKFGIVITVLSLILFSCASQPLTTNFVKTGGVSSALAMGEQTTAVTAISAPTALPEIQAMQSAQVPNFEHIVLIVLENRDYQEVMDGQSMPYLDSLAQKNVLLSNYFGVQHPSLPNYIALVSGSTQGINKNCTDCFVPVSQPNLADLIEKSGRTWKTYQEDLPSPCYVGNAKPYFQKHNPFIYFDSIRLDSARCQRSIVPLTSLDADLAANQLPGFSFIVPNICHSGHDCPAATADGWVKDMLAKLQASPALGQNSLIIVTFDEGGEKSTGSCCGLASHAGGQVVTVLVSPLARPAYQDATAYSHYSLLKTILAAWNLPELGNTQLLGTELILAPWQAVGAEGPGATSVAGSSTQTAPINTQNEAANCSTGLEGTVSPQRSASLQHSTSLQLCLTDPDEGATLSGEVTVTAELELSGSTASVQKVVFALDGTYLLSDYQRPYTFTLPTDQWADGSHKLSAEAQMRDSSVSPQAGVTLNFKNAITTPALNTAQFQPATGTMPVNGAAFSVAVGGDGASGETNAAKVSDLIASLNPNLFLYLGDVYEKGSPTEFLNWYGTADNNFGRFRAITNPTIGNHEYLTSGAAGYFDYWNNIPDYYSYDAGGWHFISLNSNISKQPVGPNSDQYKWLARDLATHSQACTIVYYHHPFFNIGHEGSTVDMTDMWKLMAQNGVTIVLNGHDHTYQRWQPLDGDGQPGPSGITEFVVGASGHGVQGISNSDNRVAYSIDTKSTAFGVLMLQLNLGGAVFRYHSIDGTVLDSGVIPCAKSAPDTQPPETPGGLAAVAAAATKVDLIWLAASDNVGVSGYAIYRDGIMLGKVPAGSLAYTDTGTLPEKSYSYTVAAYDPAGNISAASSPALVNTPEISSKLGFPVIADAYVSAANPVLNYGRVVTLRADSSPDVHSYLRFNVLGLGGKSIARAILKIYANSGSSKGFSVLGVADNTWNENTLNFDGVPALGSVLASSGALKKGGGWISLDVSAYVTGEGMFSFGLVTSGSTALSFGSRESGANAPQLLIDLR